MTRRTGGLVPLVWVVAIASLVTPRPVVAVTVQEPSTLVIANVTVLDVEAGRVVPDRTVVIQGGLIVGVEEAATASVPSGATVVDGSGRFLSPGYADMHVHPWGQASLDLLLAKGITTARVMNGSSAYLSYRGYLSMGLARGPSLIVASPIMEGTPPPEQASVVVTEGRVIVDDSASAADSVRSFVDQGYDEIKVYNNLNSSAYRGIVTEAARLGVPVVGHVPLRVGLAGVFDSGQRSVEHLRGYVLEAVPGTAPDQPAADFRSRLIAWRHADTARLRAWARRTAERATWSTPTLGVLADLAPQAEIDRVTSRPGWQRCMSGRYADPVASRNRAPYFAVMSDEDFRATQEGVAVQKQLVRMLDEEGGNLLVGTDRLPWGFAFHWELEELADAGLPPRRVMRAATLDAATYLGRDAEAGTVEVGKVADLVLLGANPFEDVGNADLIEAVVKNGVLYDAARLEELIDSACRTFAEVS